MWHSSQRDTKMCCAHKKGKDQLSWYALLSRLTEEKLCYEFNNGFSGSIENARVLLREKGMYGRLQLIKS